MDRSTSRDSYSYIDTYSSLPNESSVRRNDFSRPQGLLLYHHVGVSHDISFSDVHKTGLEIKI